MIRIVAGILVCIFGVLALSVAIYLGWGLDVPGFEPIGGDVQGTASTTFALFSIVLIGAGGYHVVRSIRRINRRERSRAGDV